MDNSEPGPTGYVPVGGELTLQEPRIVGCCKVLHLLRGFSSFSDFWR